MTVTDAVLASFLHVGSIQDGWVPATYLILSLSTTTKVQQVT
jgi:hypothetical protein